MRSIQTSLVTAFAVVALAACGGGQGAVPPNGSGSIDPNGSTVAFEKTTLWVGYRDARINAFAANANGRVTPEKSLSAFPWPSAAELDPGVVDLAVAPDGTLWVLENSNFALGGRGWRLFAVARGDSQPENIYGDNVNSPFAIGLAGDGIMVGLYTATGGYAIATFPYASSNAPPMRTFTSTTPIYGFAEGNDGHLYVSRPGGRVDVYDPTSTGCCPLRSIMLEGLVGHIVVSAQEFAVGPDGSIYATDLPGSQANPVMFVNVYAPGSGAVARRIGPLPADYSGFGFPVITVDAKNRLYVATTGNIYRFGPSVDGAVTRLGGMIDPTLGRPGAMAVGPRL